jgi:preprotein translocase subunit Sss1
MYENNPNKYRELSKKIQVTMKRLSRKTRSQDWEKFIKSLKRNITGAQRIGLKIYYKLTFDAKGSLIIRTLQLQSNETYAESNNKLPNEGSIRNLPYLNMVKKTMKSSKQCNVV